MISVCQVPTSTRGGQEVTRNCLRLFYFHTIACYCCGLAYPCFLSGIETGKDAASGARTEGPVSSAEAGQGEGG